MERFQNDYQTVIQRRCLRMFGFPESEVGQEKRQFELETFPRVAEIFLDTIGCVSRLSSLQRL